MVHELPTDANELRELLLAERARRTEAENALKQFHERGSLPLLNPNPVMQVDASGKLLFANAAAGQLALEMKATGPSRVRPQLQQAVTEALRRGEATQREIMAHDRRYLLFAVPVVDGGFAMLYLVDVTAKWQAEQQQQQQHEFYETILAHLPAVVAVLDPDQRYRFLNSYDEPDPARRQSQVGRTFADYCAEHGLPIALAVRRRRLFERALDTRTTVSWEEQWPGAEGQPPVYWLWYYQPVYSSDGVLRLMMCYGLDITSRRLAEAHSRASEAEVQAQQAFTDLVLNLNPNLIWVRDSQGNALYENAQMQALRKLAADTTGAATMESGMDKEEMKVSAMADQQVLRTRQPLTIVTTITLGNGEVRWYQTVRCPLEQPDGTVQVLGVSTDITALKEAQHAAEAAATARENFLANMSHEIRTPLNGVLGMTNLLAKTALNEQQRNYLSIIQHSGRHLLNVVNDVLDIAKITSGKLELEQSTFNLCDSMGKASQPLVLQAQEKGIRVVGTMLRESCPLPWVVGDSYRLNQVLINLISNAIKFTPAGGTISVGGYFVSETADTLTTEFRVTDTGIGIAPHKLESIFQEFTQAYADTTRQFGGTGLGLSISRALVAQMGGRLTVESELGKGSSFSFITTLPKAHPQDIKRALETTPPPQTASLKDSRMLLVEDNPVNREVVLQLLQGYGVEVDEAASGQEALDLFAKRRYDVVLMDIQMPGMNGLEATARIRAYADPVRAATPILALTANAFRADAEKYYAAGMNDTLPKPFDEAELLRKLAALIAGSGGQPAFSQQPPPEEDEPTPAAAPAANNAPPPLFDLTTLQNMAHGSATFMDRILASFHSNTPESITALNAAAASGDWKAAAAAAHKLRPSLQLLGANSLAPALAAIESPDSTDADRATGTEQLIAGLEQLLQALPTTAPL